MKHHPISPDTRRHRSIMADQAISGDLLFRELNARGVGSRLYLVSPVRRRFRSRRRVPTPGHKTRTV